MESMAYGSKPFQGQNSQPSQGGRTSEPFQIEIAIPN